MFKKIFITLCFIFSIGNIAQAANPVSDIVESATDPKNYFIFGQIQSYYDVIDELNSKKVELEVLEQSRSVQEKSITKLKEEIRSLGAETVSLSDQIEALNIQEEISPSDKLRLENLNAELNDTQTVLDDQKKKLIALENELSGSFTEAQTEKTILLQNEIFQLEEDLATSQIRLKNYVEDYIKKIVLAIAIWIVASVLKWIITKIFNRINFSVTAQRKAFILQLIKITINTVAIIAILLVFFSQLIRALPYFAIFATVITLALKDVILSVIAWIIIGTKDGYKVGHYLHIGDLWGTVVEINPFNTIVRQGGISGPTGRLLTFPNKKIFEEFLENWSKWHNFTYLKWDFFLEADSNFDKAEKIMLKIMGEAQKEYKEKMLQKKNQLLKLGIREENLDPMVFWETQANGLLLRGKLIVDFDLFFEIRTRVTRDFIKAIQKEPDIKLRFVNNLVSNSL